MESARSARRVRLAGIVSGSLSNPPVLRDSSRDDYEPPVITASSKLESRYFHLLSLCVDWLVVGVRVLKVLFCFFFILFTCRILVADPGSGPGFESSGVSDVFVFEQALDSPAVESEATSVLPEDGGVFKDSTWTRRHRSGTLRHL